MQRIRELWSRLDTINRIILFSGVAVAIGFLAMKQGKSAVAVVVLMGVFMLNHASQRRKACHRMYGNLYFHMPDGEIVPRMFTNRGIRFIILDIDNTVAPYTVSEASVRMKAWVQGMKNAGLELYVLSNNRGERPETFASVRFAVATMVSAALSISW